MFLDKKCQIISRAVFLVVSILSFTVSYADSRGTIVGQVLDSTGLPLEGVSVSVIKNGPATITNAGGMFTLNGVKQKKKVVVTFRKDGYLTTQGAVSLKIKLRKDHDRDHDSDDKVTDRDDDDGSEQSEKLQQATLVRTMLKLGTAQTINNATGAVVKEAGSKVTFTANSLSVNGDVQVTVTPIDVSTSAILAAPGDFVARTSNGQRVLLETFTMADISLSQNGQPVNLAPGAQAKLELLLPAGTRLQVGDTQPMWYFSEQSGLWIEDGIGTIGASTEVPGRLAAFADVTHFSPWNLDYPSPPLTYVGGRIVGANGQPLAGAYVYSYSVGQTSGAFRSGTNNNGYYCVAALTNTTVYLSAYYSLSGLLVHSSNVVQLQTGGATNTCNFTAPTLVIDTATSCVSGDVLNANGAPVVGATVFSTSGGFGTTNINGAYRLPAPANTQVVVYSAGYPSVTVTTGATTAPCASAPMRVVTGGGIACVSGFLYQCSIANRYPGIQVTASDTAGNPLGISQPSNANGEYCIDGLPANTNLRITSPGYGGLSNTNSGNGGGTCATNRCNTLPGIDVFCY